VAWDEERQRRVRPLRLGGAGASVRAVIRVAVARRAGWTAHTGHRLRPGSAFADTALMAQRDGVEVPGLRFSKAVRRHGRHAYRDVASAWIIRGIAVVMLVICVPMIWALTDTRNVTHPLPTWIAGVATVGVFAFSAYGVCHLART